MIFPMKEYIENSKSLIGVEAKGVLKTLLGTKFIRSNNQDILNQYKNLFCGVISHYSGVDKLYIDDHEYIVELDMEFDGKYIKGTAKLSI